MLARSRSNGPIPQSPLNVPRFVDAGPALVRRWGAPVFVVVSPGQAGGLDLRAGDLLVASGEPAQDDLVMLVPQRRGRPMLGRMTRRGVVAEPGGASCNPDRWRPVGRVAAHIRPLPQARPRVLHFPEKADAAQESLPLPAGAPAEGEAAPHVRVALDAPPDAALRRFLATCIAGLRFLSPTHAVGLCGAAFERSPITVAESLTVEIAQRFGRGVRLAVAPDGALADRLLARLEEGGVAVASGTLVEQPAAPVAPRPTAEKPQQLGLWG